MADSFIIGIDAGTSVIKSVLFDSAGNFVDSARLKNHYQTHPGGRVEQDMLQTRDHVFSVLKTLVENNTHVADKIIAIAVTGQGDGTWPVDSNSQPVLPAFLWLDSRSSEFVEEYIRNPDYGSHFQSTGTGINPCQQSAQMAWLKKNAPSEFKKIAHVLHCKDWIFLNLTGEIFTDPSESNFTFGNYKTREYNPEIIKKLGLKENRSLLPPILDGTHEFRPLLKEVAQSVGLKTGTPVILGYVDVICSGLGSGLFDERGKSGCTILGSTGMHMKFFGDPEKVLLNSQHTGYTMCFPSGKSVANMQSNMSASINVDWAVDLLKFAQNRDLSNFDSHKILTEAEIQLRDLKPTGILYHPYISDAGERGPFLDSNARAQFFGLDRKNDFSVLLGAIYEGLSYAAKDCYEAMGDLPDCIRLSGGIANSEAAKQIFADVLGAEVSVAKVTESGAAGAAMMAAVQTGLFENMAECEKVWIRPKLSQPIQPQREKTNIYNELFEIYKEVRKWSPPIWKRLHQFKQTHNL